MNEYLLPKGLNTGAIAHHSLLKIEIAFTYKQKLFFFGVLKTVLNDFCFKFVMFSPYRQIFSVDIYILFKGLQNLPNGSINPISVSSLQI